jgi:hypothetical protein
MEEEKTGSLQSLWRNIIIRQVSEDAFQWLTDNASAIGERDDRKALNMSFAAVPRKTGKHGIEVSEEELLRINELYPGFSIRNWTIDRLCRVWLLLHVSPLNETGYHQAIEGLFRDAEMNELATLYAALPVFAYPASWQFRATEGIRSNIGTVLEAIMYDNPYPFRHLAEEPWNQLVLKAFFTEKDVNRIIGLDERANSRLAEILVDYAHERQAAHRMVNPQLWRLVAPFINERSVHDIGVLFDNVDVTVRRAGVLACYHSNYPPARQLLDKEPEIVADIEAHKLGWNSL